MRMRLLGCTVWVDFLVLKNRQIVRRLDGAVS